MLVDIITGFLGAGKTTLINKLIPIYMGRAEKVVVIENEYGSVNIDKYLFENENIAVYEMTSGCLCCTLKGNLELSLQEIRDNIKPDRVVIEPSGIFVIDEMLTLFNTIDFKVFKINQIITVVDGMHFLKYRNKYNGLLGVQIKSADYIIVSKFKEEMDAMLLQNNIRAFNSSAPILQKPWEALSAYELEKLIDRNKPCVNASRRRIKKASKLMTKISKSILHDFETNTIEVKSDYTKESFKVLIDDLKKNLILRCKGFISLENKDYLLQYTDGEYTLEETHSMRNKKILVTIK